MQYPQVLDDSGPHVDSVIYAVEVFSPTPKAFQFNQMEQTSVADLAESGQ
jgi:hypothetical protein